MSLDSYDELKAEIIDHLDRDDLSEKADTFIRLAEARHKRELRLRQMEVRAEATIDEATGYYLALPSGFIQMQTLRLLSCPGCLEEVSVAQIGQMRRKEPGKPRYFAIHEELEFDSTVEKPEAVSMIYWRAFTPLSLDNQTNPLLLKAPDAYLYGALSASAPYVQEDERIEVWERYYSVARDGLILSDRRSRFGNGPLVSRVAGPTP